MPAEVESMFSVREKPWHGLGTIVAEAPTSKRALELAGLDWNVVQEPVYLKDGIQVPNLIANIRDKDRSVLGTVSSKYKVVQNTEAFEFTDSLLGNGVTYETAGSLKNGKTIWLLTKTPKERILGDDYEPYICFTNTHDGSGAVKVVASTVRVCCCNTLNLALSTAKRSWSCRHMGDMAGKKAEAEMCLNLAAKYNKELAIYAERAANTKVTEDEVNKIVNDLFPVNTDDSNCKQKNAEESRQAFIDCTYAVDLRPFYGTLWGLINAASDFDYHRVPQRRTQTYAENNMVKAINGSKVIDYITELYSSKVS